MQENDKIKDICGFCGAVAVKKCSACRQVNYCSKEHQKDHWKSHKSNCKPFVLQKNAAKGRYLTASRDIKTKEILFKEEPIVIGPKLVCAAPVCLGCLKPIVSISSSPKCSKCRWPVCDLRCPEIASQHEMECKILAVENKRERKIYRYELITPLRCLLLKKHNPQKWAVISEMEAHLEQRTPNTELYREVQELFLYLKNNILKNINYDEDISQDIFHQICGILDVNSLDVPFESIELSALYPTFALMEHSCLPNVKISFNKFQVIIKSANSINTNENISTMYTNVLWGTQMRQQHLQNTKYFTCCCSRCKDPTELGTHFSSIRCLQQKHPNVQELETLLQKLLSVLHPCHYNCFSIKHSLIQLYGHQSGYQYSHLSNELLNQKIEYCRELISVLSKLDSTGSRTPLYIAVTKYELSAANLEVSRRIFLETLNLSLIQDKEKEAKQFLIESVLLLNEEKCSNTNVQLIQSCKKLYKEFDDILNGQYFTDF